MRLSPNISLSELQNDIDDALLMDVKPLLGELHDKLTADAPAEQLTPLEEKAQAAARPVWVCHAYQRFLQFHGIDVSSTGLTKQKAQKGEYEHVSTQERSILLNAEGGKVAYWEGELGKVLKEINGTGRGGSKRSRVGMRVLRPR